MIGRKWYDLFKLTLACFLIGNCSQGAKDQMVGRSDKQSVKAEVKTASVSNPDSSAVANDSEQQSEEPSFPSGTIVKNGRSAFYLYCDWTAESVESYKGACSIEDVREESTQASYKWHVFMGENTLAGESEESTNQVGFTVDGLANDAVVIRITISSESDVLVHQWEFAPDDIRKLSESGSPPQAEGPKENCAIIYGRQAMTEKEADAWCQSHGAELANINADSVLIWELMSDRYTYWIGRWNGETYAEDQCLRATKNKNINFLDCLELHNPLCQCIN